MALLIILVALVSIALVYIPVAMILKRPLQDRLSKGFMRNPWVRFGLIIGVLFVLAVFVRLAVRPDMKEAWESILLWSTVALAVLSAAANARIPRESKESTPDTRAEEKSRPFWDWTERVNANSFVAALAAVIGAMSLGVSLV